MTRRRHPDSAHGLARTPYRRGEAGGQRDRDRYAEEYLGELAALAADGAGRWRQLGHALLLLARAGELRLTLAAASRRREAA